jgi:hypothetical protein
LFFTLNPTFVHHPLLAILCGKNINLDLFYNKNMLTKNERCKYATINPKAQTIFVHTIVNVILKYMLQVKNKKELSNNNFGVLDHIKPHYGCYKTIKIGSLHMHTLSWLNDYLDPNTLLQTLLDYEIFQQNMINYLSDIIT